MTGDRPPTSIPPRIQTILSQDADRYAEILVGFLFISLTLRLLPYRVCWCGSRRRQVTKHKPRTHDDNSTARGAFDISALRLPFLFFRGTGDQLKKLLATVFTKGLVDAEALKHSNLLNLTQQAGDESLLDKVTPATLAGMGGEAEVFRLSDTVQMYLDEIGALKKLPPNKRAGNLAAQCGYGAGVSFHGDMYVGRYVEHKNVSFTLDDMDPAAAWLKTAPEENLRHQANDGRVGGMSAEEIATKGGSGDGYTWKQDNEEVEVTVPVPEGTRGKEIKVAFKPSSVKVTVPSKDNFELSFDLFANVSTDDCTWSLSDGSLVITMEKASSDETWPALVKAK